MKLPWWFSPKWVVLSVWRRRRAIFYTISAISLVGNAVALAESLEVRGSTLLDVVLHRLVPHLRDLGSVLSQRPILYMLLNFIVLRIVIKSGVLGKQAESKAARHPLHDGRHHGPPDRAANHRSVPIRQYFNEDNEQARTPSLAQYTEKETPCFNQPNIVTDNSSAHPASLGHLEDTLDDHLNEQTMTVTSAGCPEEHCSPKERTSNNRQKLKRASLFTIEPLVDHGQSSATPGSTVAINNDRRSTTASSPEPNTQHKDILVAQGSSKEHGRADYYDLNRQEFNERVEGFIAKFKRNLTMQRQDSFNRLLGLVGAGGSMRRS